MPRLACAPALWVGVVFGALAPARAGEKDPPVAADISAVQDQLKILTDGNKHYVAVIPFGPSEHLYYGDGKTFFAQRVSGSSRSGNETFDFVFWEPRVKARYQAGFEFREGKYQIQCEERKTVFTPLPDPENRALLERAKFFQPRWRHRAHALARDERGTYYYVDRVREPEDSKSFRIYAGLKGSMKQLKMTNVVSDSEGEIFATRSGDLRLILARNEAAWVRGKKRSKLIFLPVEDNHVLIYSDLGVYTGQRLGTPCDDL